MGRMVNAMVWLALAKYSADGWDFRSSEIAFYTAISAVALGIMAAFVLTRIPRFHGKALLGGMVTARKSDARGDHRFFHCYCYLWQ